MANLKFNNTDVLRCVEHALAAPKHGKGYGDNGEAVPALFFDKDEGLYVMSNGEPRDPITTTSPNGKHQIEGSFVAYAAGYDPAKHDAGVLHDKCSYAVGGDYFGETIPLTPAIVSNIRKGSDLFIDVTASQLKVRTELVRSEDETRDWLQGVMDKQVVYYPTPRHKRLKAFLISDVVQVAAARIRVIHPKAVILNELSLDEAVAAYRG